MILSKELSELQPIYTEKKRLIEHINFRTEVSRL
jgi:hypothetical protein